MGDSFDSVDSPLRVVQECMARLQTEYESHEQQSSSPEDEQVPVKFSHPLELNYDVQSNAKAAMEPNAPIEQEEGLEIEELMEAAETVALDWKSCRNSKECSCSFVFDAGSRRTHCWSCGDIFCVRCIEKKIILPGHRVSQVGEEDGNSDSDSDVDVGGDVFRKQALNTKNVNRVEKKRTQKTNEVPVCNGCYKKIYKSNSQDSS